MADKYGGVIVGHSAESTTTVDEIRVTYLVDEEQQLNNGELGFMFNLTVNSRTTEAVRRHQSRHQHSRSLACYYNRYGGGLA